jgi:uncharacterized membrane protein
MHFRIIISNILRYGALLSSLTIAVGLFLIFARAVPPDFPNLLGQLIEINYGKPTLQLDVLLKGIMDLNPVSIIQLGTLILLAIPIIRVAISAILFARERDLIYVAVTAFVLVVLLFSIFIVGPLEAKIGK